jgi:hypothetical protein
MKPSRVAEKTCEIELAVSPMLSFYIPHSHSIVPGGFDVMS